MKTLKERCQELEKVMLKFSNFGAADSEPMWQLKNSLYCKINKSEDKIPQNSSQWELYEGMAGVGKAAKSMTDRLTTIINAIPTAPYEQVKELVTWYDIEE